MDTRFSVRAVVNYVLKQGVSPEELVVEFPQLTLAKVYDALSYYYDYQAEVDADIEECAEAHLKPKKIA